MKNNIQKTQITVQIDPQPQTPIEIDPQPQTPVQFDPQPQKPVQIDPHPVTETEEEEWPELPSPLPDLDLEDSFALGHYDRDRDIQALTVKVDMMYGMIKEIWKKMCLPVPTFQTATKTSQPVQCQNVLTNVVPVGNNEPATNTTYEHFSSQYLSLDRALEIKGRSCSPGNFARNLVEELFTKEERENRNVTGTKKQKLDEDGKRMEFIKDLVFRLFNISPVDRPRTWVGCITAIDEFLRHKPRGNKATNWTDARRVVLLNYKQNLILFLNIKIVSLRFLY